MTEQDIECAWPLNHILEVEYHNNEWGKPIYDDQQLFEFLVLEGAQAGLSWLTILKRRTAYYQAFEGYVIEHLAQYDESRVEWIIEHENVIRNRRKIASVFNNARACLQLQQEYGSLQRALWQFVGGKPRINQWQCASQVPAYTEESIAMSRFLKKKDFQFVGPTICYAFMQATGMVNDHLVTCPQHGLASERIS